MRKLLIVLLILSSRIANAQTLLPATTTVHDLSLMKSGQYRIITATDTTDITKDTSLILTVPKVCPVCPVPVVCPPPVVCPACPQIPAPRVATGITWDIILNKKIITYNTGPTSTL